MHPGPVNLNMGEWPGAQQPIFRRVWNSKFGNTQFLTFIEYIARAPTLEQGNYTEMMWCKDSTHTGYVSWLDALYYKVYTSL